MTHPQLVGARFHHPGPRELADDTTVELDHGARGCTVETHDALALLLRRELAGEIPGERLGHGFELRLSTDLAHHVAAEHDAAALRLDDGQDDLRIRLVFVERREYEPRQS